MPRRNPRDPEGHYSVLNISPGANVAEVRLAYTFLKNAWNKNRALPRARIKAAYDFLSNPACKAEYDRGRRKTSKVNARMVGVIALGAALLGFGGFVFPGFLLPSPEPFRAGDFLVGKHDFAPLGEIVRRETHTFTNGRKSPAYLVRLDAGGEQWFPVSDMENHYRQRGAS